MNMSEYFATSEPADDFRAVRSRPAADWADMERDRMLTAQARADRQAMIDRWHDARLRAAFNGDFRDEPVNRWRIDFLIYVIAAMIGAVLIGWVVSLAWAWLVGV